MKVLLISENRVKDNLIPYPLGIACVAASTRAAGHEVRCLDLMFSEDPRADTDAVLSSFNPDCVGIAVRNIDNQKMFEPDFYLEDVREVIRTVRDISRAEIVLGGAGFSIFPIECLEYLDISVGIVGEAEETFVSVLQSLERGGDPSEAPGVASVKEGRPRINPRKFPYTLDMVPIPDRRCPDTRSYNSTPEEIPSRMSNIQSRRGCHMSCIYCSSPTIEGKTVRLRNPVDVVRELEVLERDFGLRVVAFTDSLFNYPSSYTRRLCEEIMRKGLAINWIANINPLFHDRNVAEKMARAGCVGVSVGNESGSDRTLEALKKGFRKDDVARAVSDCKDLGMRVNCFLILGGPGETRETVKESVELMDTLKPHTVSITVGIRIYPDCELEAIALERGIITRDQNLLFPAFYLEKGLDPWLYEYMKEACAAREGWSI